ncbi:MAG: DUF6861 domain-containing protein [Burkholderiales bacterium]
MGTFQNPFQAHDQSADPVHPGAPAGGCGPGFSRAPSVTRGPTFTSALPHTGSPAGRFFDWQGGLDALDFPSRVSAVYHAVSGARAQMAKALLDATGQELHQIVEGILPGLLMLIAVLAAITALGAAAGAALGALAFGVGAAPGAAVGAGLGFEAGLAVLNYLGLAFLAVYIGKSLMAATRLAARAVVLAWESVDRARGLQQAAVDDASKTLAAAAAELLRGVLQGIVAFLLAKGTAAAAARVPELSAKLRASKLGAGFAEWVERNWSALVENPKLKEAPTAPVPVTRPSPTPSAAPQKLAQRSEPEPPPKAPVKSHTETQLDEMYAKAPAAKTEIDATAQKIADQTGGTVAKAPLKGRARALEKALNDYEGDASRINDLARNTVVVEQSQYGKAVALLEEQASKIKTIDAATDPMGYSGANAVIKTQAGISAEIQVNTPEMIYAKESPSVAKAILGESKYAELAGQTGVPGGRGHELYEAYRSLPAGDAGRTALEAESRAYYDGIRQATGH